MEFCENGKLFINDSVVQNDGDDEQKSLHDIS